MAWKVEIDERAFRELRKLDKNAQKQILSFLRERVETSDNPTSFGKPLIGNLSGLWRYRIGDYRIICRIIQGNITILVVKIGHRKNVYE